MRAVLAGGAGFLGSHIADWLLARGDEVVALDDLSTGSHDNLTQLEGHPRFSLVVTDVSVCAEVEGPVDAVIHLASPASPPAYLARPLATLAAGSEGTRLLLELARAKSARFLLASTSEVYGDPTVHPQSEAHRCTVDPTGPRGAYDEARRCSEALTMAHHRACETNVVIARIFNTYGPRLQPGDGRVVSNFITQALAGRPLSVFGDGSQTRSLCYVDDQVTGLMALLESSLTGPVNLGNPEERTVLQIATAVLEATESKSEIALFPPRPDDPMRRCPDITVAQRDLGWSPEISLEVGLARTAAHFARA